MVIRILSIHLFLLLFYIGCNLKDEHTHIKVNNEDSLKTAALLTEIKEIWVKIDKHQKFTYSIDTKWKSKSFRISSRRNYFIV